MRPFLLGIICLAAHFQIRPIAGLEETPTIGVKNIPRLLCKDVVKDVREYQTIQNHSVFLYLEDSKQLYVGGTDFILKLDVDNYKILENISLTSTDHQQCDEKPCENAITVIEKFQDSIFVCGTNGHRPQCWKLFTPAQNETLEIMPSYEGTGISPFVHTHNCLSLSVEGDLYAAAPLDADGSSLQFRRKAGGRTNVWMDDSWVTEPTFVSASWIKRENDPDNEKIYIFFREKNSGTSLEADPWISRVGRVCKVDEGGSKRFLQNKWTSFLKARLVCGFPEESLYFTRLQDVYVIHAEDWHDTKVYALFTSSWNSTAICIYSIGMIEDVFENSTFKGFDKDIPDPRPGTCVSNSRSLPRATVNVVKDYPEMTDWVHSLHYTAPFYVSNNNYTKIVVDRVQAADQNMYNVLFLATDAGKIHKVLEAGSEPFIIYQTQLSNKSSIQVMKIDSQMKKLVVGFSEKVTTVDLQRCQEYNSSCAHCVLARDPYCSWTESGCVPTVVGSIQNIVNGEISVCPEEEEATKPMNRGKRETVAPWSVNLWTEHSVPRAVPFYLSCPIDSYHAVYTWEHHGRSSPCLQMLSNCLHLIPSMAQENYGNYKCVSVERDYKKVVKEYQLIEQKLPEERRNIEAGEGPLGKSSASALVPQLAWVTLLVEAVVEIIK